MIKRRHFLLSGAFATGMLTAPLAARACAAASALPAPQLLLHDTRFPAAAGLASSFTARQGNASVASLPLSGDVTRLWCDTLQPLWQSAPASIAGVTGEDVLFCLEQLAAGHGLRVLERQVLSRTATQALVAWQIGPRRGGVGTQV